MTYYIIKCPGCERPQVFETKKEIQDINVRCRFDNCKFSRKAKLKRQYGLSIKVLYITESGSQAAELCRLCSKENDTSFKIYKMREVPKGYNGRGDRVPADKSTDIGREFDDIMQTFS